MIILKTIKELLLEANKTMDKECINYTGDECKHCKYNNHNGINVCRELGKIIIRINKVREL